MIEIYPHLLEVETASSRLRRLYRIIRETMRAMAGRLSGVASWEAKKMLARHIWLDAEHADSLRQRVLELRYPRVDVDLAVDEALLRVLRKLPSTRSDLEFLAGVYGAVKPAVFDALAAYLEQSDPLDDAPTHRIIPQIIREMRAQFGEYQKLIKPWSQDGLRQTEPWQAWLREALALAGGMNGPDTGAAPLERPGFSDRPAYQIAMIPERDPRWLAAVTQVPPRPPRTPQEQQVWIAIDHVNELWACELPGALMWHYDGLPWFLYRDSARWAYDEMRHAMMGERRLHAWGFEVGVDVPMVPDHWHGVASRGGLEAMLFVVHGLEQGGPKWKAQLKQDLWHMGDPHSAQDCDYDWADEAGHIRYGQDWIKAVFPTLSKAEVMARTQAEVEHWREWIAEKHRTGQHGYGVFLPRIEALCARMPAVAHPDYFQPMGSSAATKSYGADLAASL